jgi:hypothetical protein
MEWIGHDRAGRPILALVSRNADLSIERERRLQYTVAILEKGISYMKREYSGHDGVEQWNVIIDETDKTMKHMDNKFLMQITPMLVTHYAQRLHRCYVVNPSWLTHMVLSVVKVFLDERTSRKICMVNAKRDKVRDVMTAKEILMDLGPENVLTSYGGFKKHMPADEYERFFAAIPFPCV